MRIIGKTPCQIDDHINTVDGITDQRLVSMITLKIDYQWIGRHLRSPWRQVQYPYNMTLSGIFFRQVFSYIPCAANYQNLHGCATSRSFQSI